MAEVNDRLVVEWTGKIDKLQDSFNKVVRGAYGAADKVDKRLKESDDRFSKLFGHAKPGEALDNVFSRSRLAVIEEGAAKIPIFGSAVEALGPAGLAAAAGVAALGLAMERTDKAIDYAAGIAKLANAAGTSTGFIQQFNFALRQNEVDVNAGDEALKNLNASLGLVQSGLARKQLANAFKAVGFTPEQLRQFHDVGDFFPVLVQRIAAVGSESERAAIAKRLGIEALIPLLNAGATGFTELAQKARDLGIIMDEGLIRQAEEAKKKLNEISDVMKAKTNIAFAEYSDTLVGLKEVLLWFETKGLDILATLTGTRPPEAALAAAKARLAELQALKNPGGIDRQDIELQQSRIRDAELALQIRAAFGPGVRPKASETPAVRQLVPSAAGGRRPRGYEPFTINGQPASREVPLLVQPTLQTPDIAFRGEPGALIEDIGPKIADGIDKGTELSKVQQSLKRFHDGLEEQTAAAIEGGLHALREGGVKGLLSYFGSMLEDAVLHSVAQGLAQALLQHGTGNLLADLFQFLPHFAGGTAFSPGGAAVVGERGPELVNLPRGSQVIPNHSLSGFGQQTQIVVHVAASDYFDARVEQISGANARRAGSAAFGAAQRSTPAALSAYQKYRS